MTMSPVKFKRNNKRDVFGVSDHFPSTGLMMANKIYFLCECSRSSNGLFATEDNEDYWDAYGIVKFPN
jgi:hypothetical protein